MKTKYKLLLLILLIPVDVVNGQDVLSFLEGSVSFQRPEHVTRWEERPNFKSVSDQGKFWRDKIRLVTVVYDAAALNAEPPTVMSGSVYDLAVNKKHLSRSDLLSLFKLNTEFVLDKYTQVADVRSSYKILRCNGVTIGETFFHADAIDLEAASAYGYTMYFIIEDKIFGIYISYFIEEGFYTANNLDTYFVKRDNGLYWKNREAISDFYECLSSAEYKKLPKQLQFLREARDTVLKSLRINNAAIEIVDPIPTFFITTDNLNLRKTYSLSSPAILTLPKGTKIQVVEVGEETTIDGISAPWMRVITADGHIGWCFSGYLERL